MKKIKFILLVVFVLTLACSKEKQSDDVLIQGDQIDPFSGSEINEIIDAEIKGNGSFSWNSVSDFTLWSAVVQGDSLITVGYVKSSESEDLKSISASQQNLKNQIKSLVNDSENCNGLKSNSNNKPYENDELYHMDIRVSNLETISVLRSMDSIRYVEPSGYNYFKYQSQLKSSSGCNKDAEVINDNDYTTYSPNCIVPWTFFQHNVTQAWNYSTGSNVTVGLIDTGKSEYQSLLGDNFNNGYSSGRTISSYGVYVDSSLPWSTSTDGVYDKCGHGTRMAATIASPRNNKGLPVGVAYNCNLITYRATLDVLLDGYHEQNGVAKALTELADNSNVKIISMSIGHIITISKIEDAVKYAYNKGKLIFAAGGTSATYTNWVGVIFPASMDETVAVTGITDSGNYEQCAVCHSGSKIDFTVVMQRDSNSDRTSVCLGYYEDTKKYIGGSSVATAFTAGVAALVWSRHPTWTRNEVLQKLRSSAEFYPNKDADFGNGNIDALAAVQ